MYWIAAYPVDNAIPHQRSFDFTEIIYCCALDQQGWKWIELEIIGPILSSSELF